LMGPGKDLWWVPGRLLGRGNNLLRGGLSERLPLGLYKHSEIIHIHDFL
jgi:hypothetical protein